MSLPNYNELASFVNINDIEQAILENQKTLFNLRIKRSTNETNKPHFFVHTKRRIAQLKFKKSVLAKLNESN